MRWNDFQVKGADNGGRHSSDDDVVEGIEDDRVLGLDECRRESTSDDGTDGINDGVLDCRGDGEFAWNI